jgi:dissimilatory sulfite reductase (desulfoviridin) alpha/beta subunit
MAATGSCSPCEGAPGSARAQPVCGNGACSHQRAEGQQRLRKCKRCMSAFYCSEACQCADWRRHKRAECVAAGVSGERGAGAVQRGPQSARLGSEEALRIVEELDAFTYDPEGTIKSRVERMVEIFGRDQPEGRRQALREGFESCIREHVPDITAAWRAVRGD